MLDFMRTVRTGDGCRTRCCALEVSSRRAGAASHGRSAMARSGASPGMPCDARALHAPSRAGGKTWTARNHARDGPGGGCVVGPAMSVRIGDWKKVDGGCGMPPTPRRSGPSREVCPRPQPHCAVCTHHGAPVPTLESPTSITARRYLHSTCPETNTLPLPACARVWAVPDKCAMA